MTHEEAKHKVECCLTDYFPIEDYYQLEEIMEALDDQTIFKEWLEKFNTDSATACFTAVQELKKKICQ